MLELPETLEEIVLWKLEHAHVESYLYHLQSNNWHWCSASSTRILVIEWLVRIHAMGIVTSVQTYRDGELARQFHTVSVAGIQICIMTWQERDEIFGETHA
jgi:hypothetical protein